MNEIYKFKNITAQIIADSINEYNDRLTTYIITIPRIVLAEFNTHRVFSRNSASSRAIPFAKMIEKVKDNPFIPSEFQKDHKGMQGNENYVGVEKLEARMLWLNARDAAVETSTKLHKFGVTKQLCNRLLEPFLMHTIIVTSTEWENFFALRHHEAAEIHIAKAAELMLEAYNNNTPKELKEGEWHIPFGDRMDDLRVVEMIVPDELMSDHDQELNEAVEDIKKKIAVARCARVSYDNYEGGDDYVKDVSLYNRLRSMGHQSPFEHVAQAMSGNRRTEGDGLGFCGNFRGWIQDRKFDTNEDRKDSRVIRRTTSISKVGILQGVTNGKDTFN